ncbi:MAG: hypothetical protein DCE92_01995 [Alphaproteobacteria bacterium]|nr:MAG: hypothetical protein DCE92_01995 [Alphaproteobacteria bacterium]
MLLHNFTCRALYDHIWAEPMRAVAQGLGVSDVGLAEACSAAGIPVPPRGWWAKLQYADAFKMSFVENEWKIGYVLPESPGAPGWWDDAEPHPRQDQHRA